ncbi:MAG: M48 family metallopeptidase [bacterium]
MCEKDMHPLIDKEKQKRAEKYHNDNLKINIVSYVISGIFIVALLWFDISKNFVVFINTVTNARFLIILTYFAVLYVIYTLITMPLAYLDGYVIEHKYGFSTQNFKGWLKDWVKSFFVSFILGAIVFEIIYLVTNISPTLWWLWLSVIMIIFSVILANLFPVLILPLFYKTSPIENEDLRSKIEDICEQTKINVQGIFSINLSSKSTKANAAVVGLGNTKRILIGDTLIADYTEGEILSVLAHEITHYREHHVWWLILWQSCTTIVMFYVFYLIYPYIYGLVGFGKVSDIAAFPLFGAIFATLAFVLKPFGSAISRYYERRADKGALNLTKDPESFIALMAKFCNKQLSIAYPNPFIEWYKYSHPSPGNRIKSAETWEAKQ